MKQTVCKVLKIFPFGKYLVAYVFNRTLVLNTRLEFNYAGYLLYKNIFVHF